MPAYLAIGISFERIMESCPAELEPFEKAYFKSVKMRDHEMFVLSRYIYEAVVCGVDNVLRGRDSKMIFRTKSFTEEAEDAKKAEDIETQRQLLINGLNSMKLNFEIAQLRKNGGEKQCLEEAPM